MVLEKHKAEDVVRYRWTKLDGTPITDWYTDLTEALDYAVKSATR